MKLPLLLLTDLNNAQEGEDRHLANELSSDFDIKIVSNNDVLESLSDGDRILIRNNWPAFGAEELFWEKLHSIYQRLRDLGTPCYNNLHAKGDMQGKVYLNSLMNEGFPVIPTVYKESELAQLGEHSRYVVKPCFGGDSWRLEILEKDQVKKRELAGFVVQPFIEIVKEVHYVFIDNEFVYAFGAKSRRDDPMPDDIQLYDPSDREVAFAQRFAQWNNLKHGLQRIDVVTTAEGVDLLNELEDHCPYLWLSKMPRDTQSLLLKSLKSSLKSWVNNA